MSLLFGVALMREPQRQRSLAALIRRRGRFYNPGLEFIFTCVCVCVHVLRASVRAFVPSLGTEVTDRSTDGCAFTPARTGEAWEDVPARASAAASASS